MNATATAEPAAVKPRGYTVRFETVDQVIAAKDAGLISNDEARAIVGLQPFDNSRC